MTESMKDKGLWAIVYAPGREYLGCIKTVHSHAQKVEDPKKEDVIRMQLNSRVALEMKPLYDYATPMGQGPDGGMGKRVFATPLGMTTEPFPSYIFDPCNIVFIDDMTRFDREEHEKYIKDAAQIAAEARRTASPLNATSAAATPHPGGPPPRFPRR